VKAFWTRVRLPPGPPKGHYTPLNNGQLCSAFLMGLPWFRQGEIIETATREAMDVIQANSVNAKTSTFEYFQVPVTLASANEADFEMVA